jgi:hypothetical protein
MVLVGEADLINGTITDSVLDAVPSALCCLASAVCCLLSAISTLKLL